MKIIIFGKTKNSEKLHKKVELSLEELGLTDFIQLETTDNENLKNKLNIKKTPALIVEEENIDFIDTIFEGIVPEDDEIRSIIISIIGGKDPNSCSLEMCGIGCIC